MGIHKSGILRQNRNPNRKDEQGTTSVRVEDVSETYADVSPEFY